MRCHCSYSYQVTVTAPFYDLPQGSEVLFGSCGRAVEGKELFRLVEHSRQGGGVVAGWTDGTLIPVGPLYL